MHEAMRPAPMTGVTERVVRRPRGEGSAYLAAGERITVKLAADECGGRWSVLEAWAPEGAGPPPHVHPLSESFYVLEGEVAFSGLVDGVWQTVVAGPGTAAHVPVDAPHTWRVVNGPARFVFLCAPGGFDRFFAAVGQPVDGLSEADLADLPVNIPALMAEAERHGVITVDPAKLAGDLDDPARQLVVARPSDAESFEVLEHLFRLRLPGRATGDSLVMAEDWHRAGGDAPLHTHPQAELFYVLEGEVAYTVEEDGVTRAWRAGAGELVYLPPHTPHAVANRSSRLSRQLMIHGDAEREVYLRRIGQPIDDPEAWRQAESNGRSRQAVERVMRAGEAYGQRLA